MKFDIQKANFWKRISAALFDFIIMMMVVVGIAAGFSAVFRYDYYLGIVDDIKNEYCEEYGIDLDISQEDFDALTEEQKKAYEDADAKFSVDPRVQIGYKMVITLTVTIVTCSILLAYIILELIVPILLKHGRTLGKKIFGLAVIRTNGVRMKGQAHFIRSIIGKCTIEVLAPVYILLMFVFKMVGGVGLIVLALFALLQVFTLIYTKNTNSAIHDLISDTVVVDMASQMIFENEEELMAYKTGLHAEEVAKKGYF